MRLGVLTDPHLNFLEDWQFPVFFKTIQDKHLDGLVVTGDIAEANSFIPCLQEFRNRLHIPIYFVLGNHDFYRGSFAESHRKAIEITEVFGSIFYLSNEKYPIRLSKDTCLIGHNGNCDGRYGNYVMSTMQLNDFRLIEEYKGLNKEERLLLMQFLAKTSADFLRIKLEQSKEMGFEKVILATHVPPFPQKNNRYNNAEFSQPFYCSRILGDLLIDFAIENPQISTQVLCGHTHIFEYQDNLFDNLEVIIGGAEYGNPTIQNILEID